MNKQIESGRCIALTKKGVRCKRSGAPYCSQHLPVMSDVAVKSMSKAFANIKTPMMSDFAVISISKAFADIKMPVISDAAAISAFKAFANIKMPVMSDAAAISISEAFSDFSAPANFDALQAALAATDPGNLSVTPLQYAAGAMLAASEGAGAPGPVSASDLMGGTLVLVVFWLVYCTSPELQALVNFFAFPLTFARYALALVKRQSAK